MGISGLLNALKPIQVTRHLSEYAGKTVAVDAYGWLHKSIHTCPMELATGRPTHKYVDYAMHRVRLLRHFQIEPYIVFDGGPLPAKKGTESSRKQAREENLARGKEFLAKGNHKLAREHFLKSIDVTPQMAFQFIKALRAESVPYVVAPYEADAQLAYLERAGIVDAILTEDSDMLVFGCQHVLYKLDAVAYTVVSISRSDFGSVTNHDGISLAGWSDKQFRAWCILSGCDYLPNIPGIGIKTACILLRKWRTTAKVVKAVALEGKKAVPADYMKNFELAEMCFLHQRVYCPKRNELVHLTEVGDGWTEELDEYVGPNLDTALAQKISRGEADPDTHLPMKDIYPSYVPRPIKKLPLFRAHPRAQSPPAKVPTFLSPKAAGKMRQPIPPVSQVGLKAAKPLPKGGILNFFGPNPTIPSAASLSGAKPTTASPAKAKAQLKPSTSSNSPKIAPRPATKTTTAKVAGTTGKTSGKRTLAQAMELDEEHDRERREAKAAKAPRKSEPVVTSSFFAAGPKANSAGAKMKRRQSDGVTDKARATPTTNAVAGPSRLSTPVSAPLRGPNKENVDITYIVIDHEEEVEEFYASDPDVALDGSQVSLQACYDAEALDVDMDEDFPDAVQQEDGYISPSPSRSKDGDDLSSPIQARSSGKPSKAKRKTSKRKGTTPVHDDDDTGLVAQTGWIASDDDVDDAHKYDGWHVIEDEDEDETSFGGADFVSSPVSVKHPRIFHKFAFVPAAQRNYHTPARPRLSYGNAARGVAEEVEEILVEPTPTPTGRRGQAALPGPGASPTRLVLGPDLGRMLGGVDDAATDLEVPCDDESDSDYPLKQPGSSSTPPSLSPDTPSLSMPPPGQGPPRVGVAGADDDNSSALDLGSSDDDARLAREAAERSQAVLNGWREKWAHSSASVSVSASAKTKGKMPMHTPNVLQPVRRDSASGTKKSAKSTTTAAQAFALRRSETNVTPMGRHALGRAKNKPASGGILPPKFQVNSVVDLPQADPASSGSAQARRSLMFETVASRTVKSSALGAAAPKAKKVIDLT